MRKSNTEVWTIIGAALVLAHAAQGQSANDLFKSVWSTTEPLYAQDAAFERVLIDAVFADELLTLDHARVHPGVLAVYELNGEEMNGAWLSRATTVVPHQPSIVPDSVATIAEGYRPEPRSILEGYFGYTSTSSENGVIRYAMPANDARQNFTLLVDDAAGRMIGAEIAAGPYRALDVHYDYDAVGAIARIVVTFSTNDNPGMLWALVDFPLGASTLERKAPSGVAPTQTPRQSSASTQTAHPKDGIVTAPIEFEASDDLIDPINLGSTSCTASDGACFDFTLVDICFNVGLGIALNTNTTLEMSGMANVEYPVEGAEGQARVTFTGTNGNSSIDFSFAYDAEVCASATVPVLGTCNSSIVLAQGSFTAASGEEAFSPFLLPGDAERPVCTGDSIAPLFIGTSPGLTICDLELSFMGGLNIDPNLDYCVSGDSMVVDGHAVIPPGETRVAKAITSEGGEILIPAEEGRNRYDVEWSGEASLAGSLTLAPVLSVTIPGIGDITIPLPGVTFQLGTLGIADVTMDDSFQVAVCSEPPRAPRRPFASRGAAPYGVNLDWEGVQAATGYRVFRAQKKNLSDAQDISGVTTELWYTDSTATTGMGGCHEGTGPIEYYYYIVAENACGESPPSAVVVGFIADPKTVAGMNPVSLGNLCIIIVALAAMHVMRRTRTKRPS